MERGAVSADERRWAVLGWIAGIPFPMLAPALIWMRHRQRSAFVVAHAGESLVAGAVLLPLGLLAAQVVLGAESGRLPAIVFAHAPPFVFALIGARRAWDGQWTSCPFADMIRGDEGDP